MCGIVGMLGRAGRSSDWLRSACEDLRHRGPDDAGIWADSQAGVALGHTRLAILDLSEAGRQPMVSACGRYHIVFNGEIYNHLELRRQLPPQAWRGHADTETLLACISRWGVERTLRATVGMFAFGLFDAVERRLVLARDRFGEKPLYYGYAGEAFVFASELAPLRAAPGFDGSIDRMALALYMQHGYVPAPRSIYASLNKLAAASWIEVRSATIAARSLPSVRSYWSAIDAAQSGARAPLEVDEPQALEMLEQKLSEAVRGQMLADVPLGAFLSGGVDSSAVVALMQAQSTAPVRTFSIGFDEAEYDESGQARLVAQHLGTAHTELIVRAADALALVPRMPSVYDEPFADSSQLPTFLVAQLARQHVTVALSGDGGDELFGGYNRYFLGAQAWPRLSRIPRPLRSALAGAIHACSPGSWDRLLRLARPMLPSKYQVRMAGDRLHKIADVIGCRNSEELYRRLVSQWWVEPLVLHTDLSCSRAGWPEMSELANQMMLLDAVTYLPDDILVKVDRAAMAVSLETRVPMLDHRVFEFAWRLPMRFKMRNGAGKWLLRRLLHRFVPEHLVERPKMGFAAPIDSWLRGPLREWAENLLSTQRLGSEGYLDADLVSRKWREHLSGQRNWQYQLWNVLMFEAWLEAIQT